ncbi:type I restriction-modification enzyme R subunit C-terminal domain-containing protein [Paenibacillus amylolyticus]|nr:type I restriction-modification enzyme R subunit C-terminal domain-containing protein [Paenibacillus amylolyticus]
MNHRVYYYDKDGKLINESLIDYTKKNVKNEYHSLNDFLQKWNNADKKDAILKELESQGILLDELQDEVGKDLDPFDLICHVAFDMPPLTRQERANNVKKRNYFAKYSESARVVLEALLDKYADEGLANLENLEVLKIPEFQVYGSPIEIVKRFGGKSGYLTVIKELQKEIYTA